MAIEFTCPRCEHLLRTSDDKAGLSAKCPACGESIWVPYAHEAAGRSDKTGEAAGAGEAAKDVTDTSSRETAGSDAALVPPPLPKGGGADVLPAEAVEGLPQRRATAPVEVNCPGCGASNEGTARQCRFCGTELPTMEAPAADGWKPPLFDMSEIMSTSWRIYTQQMGLLIGSYLLVFVMSMALGMVVFLPVLAVVAILQDDSLFGLIPLVLILVPLVIAGGVAIQIGFQRVCMNVVRGPSAGVGDLLYGFGEGRKFILRMVLAGIVIGVLVLIGFVFCIAPGLVIAMSSWPVIRILMDRDPPGLDVIGIAWDWAKRDLGPILGIGAIVFGIQLVTSFIPYLGLILQIFALPFCEVFCWVGFQRMTKQRTVVD